MTLRVAITGLVGLAVLGAAPAAVWWTHGTLSLRAFDIDRSEATVRPVAPLAPPPALAASGRVEPESEAVTLAADLTGQLQSVSVKEGDHVSRGQIVAEYVNADEAARVAAALATVAQRQAALDKLLAGARPEQREEAAAQLHQTEADVTLARSQDTRRQTLRQSGDVSVEEADRARATLAVAEAKRDAAQAAVTLINAPPRPEDVAMARAALQLATADLAAAKAAYDKTIVRAPVDGVVLRRYRRAGETVGSIPPTPILEIGDTARLRVRAEVDEADLGRLALGQRVEVKAAAYGNREFAGVVTRIAPELGRKRLFSGRPTDRLDTDVLEADVEMDPGVRLPIGLRVDVFFQPTH